MNLKEIARKYISAVNHYDVDAIVNMVEENYIQHNPFVPTGRLAFIEFLSKLKVHGSRIENLRLFEDGPYIFMHHIWHNAIPFGSHSALAFHIIRINQHGHIVEHWNVMTPLQRADVLATNGFREVCTPCYPNLTVDTRNRTLRLVKELVGGELSESAVSRLFHRDFVDYTPSSNRRINDLRYLLCGSKPKLNYLKQHKVFAEGEFALSVSEGHDDLNHVIIYDLLRHVSGKIIGRWSITMPIPTAQLANDNTMFGFS